MVTWAERQDGRPKMIRDSHLGDLLLSVELHKRPGYAESPGLLVALDGWVVDRAEKLVCVLGKITAVPELLRRPIGRASEPLQLPVGWVTAEIEDLGTRDGA